MTDPQNHVKMDVEVPHELLHDIMVTAFDGTYGGVWSVGWAGHIETVRGAPKEGKPDHERDWLEVTISMEEPNDAEGTLLSNEGARDEIAVTREVLVKGIQGILDDDSAPAKWKAKICQAIMDGDAGEIDSSDADSIVQYGLFGVEVYG